MGKQYLFSTLIKANKNAANILFCLKLKSHFKISAWGIRFRYQVFLGTKSEQK